MGRVVIDSLFNNELRSLSSGRLGPTHTSLCSEEDGLPSSFLLDVGGEAFEELGIFSLGHGSED